MGNGMHICRNFCWGDEWREYPNKNTYRSVPLTLVTYRAVSIYISKWYIGLSANFWPYQYRRILFDNLYRYWYKRKERKKNEELEKGWIVNTKDLQFTFKVYCNFVFDLRLLKLTNLFSTYISATFMTNGDHASIINASAHYFIFFHCFISVLVSANM